MTTDCDGIAEQDRKFLENQCPPPFRLETDEEGQVCVLGFRNEQQPLPEMSKLNGLKVFYASGCAALPELPASVHAVSFTGSAVKNSTALKPLAKLKDMTFLDLSYNQMTSIPKWLERMRHLAHIKLSGNELSLFPTGLPTVLSTLDLSSNKIRSFPHASNLKGRQFHELRLSHNLISQIPSALDMSELRLLDLSHNRFVCLPDELMMWRRKASMVNVSGNPITQETLEELSKMVKKGSHPLLFRLADQENPRDYIRYADFRGNQIDSIADGWLEGVGRRFPPVVGY